jgi:pyruvate,water dikinase
MLGSELARIEGIDLRILSSAALDATLSDAHRLLHETGTTLLTAYGGLLSALVPLRAALSLLFRERGERMLRTLISGIEDVESAGPGRALLSAALAFRGDAAAAQRLLSDDPLIAPEQLPGGRARQAVEDLLRRYGHRGVREAELAEPRWREQPQLLFDALRGQLAHATTDAGDALERRLRDVRASGDATLKEVPLPLRPAFKGLLNVVRDYLRLRERLRSHVVRVLGLLRLIALDASRRLSVREPSAGLDAAFMLALPELHAVLRGELTSVGGLVRLRRAQLARDRSLPDPPDTFVGFPTVVPSGVPREDCLRGLGASPGAAEGVVRVVRNGDDTRAFRPGEILVVTTADVGLSPLFVVAGGLVTDVGGPLSHACVVAREYGLPAVVNVRTATRALHTGERVRVDGDAGLVQRLDGPASVAAGPHGAA